MCRGRGRMTMASAKYFGAQIGISSKYPLVNIHKNYGKSPSLIKVYGIPTINVQISIAMLVSTRG